MLHETADLGVDTTPQLKALVQRRGLPPSSLRMSMSITKPGRGSTLVTVIFEANVELNRNVRSKL